MPERFNRSRYDKTPPAGFRRAECVMHGPTGPLKIEGFIPDDDHYPSEATRLSRKATRGTAYENQGWNDALQVVLKTRETSTSRRTPFSVARVTIRELHDAEKTPDDSLLQIHFITTNKVGEHIDGEEIFPMEYTTYTPAINELKRYYINTYTPSMEDADIQEAMQLADQMGESITSDRERMTFHAALKLAAGE